MRLSGRMTGVMGQPAGGGEPELIRLPDQQADEETGLYYNRHRYYDPQQGRYITQDPIGLAGGWNGYTDPLNPTKYIDPLGLTKTAQSYIVSRDLAALGDEARSRWNPLTHTFTVMTDGQGIYCIHIVGGMMQI